MNRRDRIIDVLKSKTLTDIIVGGWIEREGATCHFQPIPMSIYLKFADVFIKASSIRQYWALSLDIVDEIICDLPMDEDDEFCTSSLSEIILKVPDHESRIYHLDEFYSSEEDPDEGIYKCVGLCLDTEDYIFLDPVNLFGIQIGGAVRRDEWTNVYMIPDGRYRKRTCDTRTNRLVEVEHIVREVIRRADPFGLCTFGAPANEFDREVHWIVRQVERIHSPSDATNIIAIAFSWWFGPGDIEISSYHSAGEDLFRALTSSGAVPGLPKTPNDKDSPTLLLPFPDDSTKHSK